MMRCHNRKMDKIGRKYYGRYTDFTLPNIEKCTFYDDSVIYIPGSGEAYYKNMNDIWNGMELVVKKKMQDAKEYGDSSVKIMGTEMLHWIKEQDLFDIAMILNMHWDYCWRTFFACDAPLDVIDVVINLRFRNGDELNHIVMKE